MPRAARLALPLALALAAPALAQEAPRVGRGDVSRAYRRFERRFLDARAGLSAEALADWNRTFDRASIAFFMGRQAATAEGLDRGLARLSGAPPAWLAAAALRVEVVPPVVVRGQGATPALRATALWAAGEGAAQAVRARVRGPAGDVLAEVEVAPGRDVPLPGLADAPVGAYAVEVVAPEGPPLEGPRWCVVARDPEAARADLARRLEALAAPPDLAEAAAAVKARLALVREGAPADVASPYLADLPARLAEVEAEVTALERGADPFRGRPGHLWRDLGLGRGKVPLRTYAPPAALARGGPLPLVIALHGVGGEASMFLEGYGAGELVRQADARGFVIASPATEPFVNDPAAFDRLVEVLAAQYPVDRRRIIVVGHSMGAGAAALLARSRADRVAGAVCLAGGGAFAPGSSPTLVIPAELDLVAPGGLLATRAERAREAGAPLEVRLARGYGHTLVVGAHLGEALDWALARPPTAGPADAPAPAGVIGPF